MTFQVRIYTSLSVAAPSEIPAIVEYSKGIDGGEVHELFTTPDHARRALHEYCAAVSSLIGGEVIKVNEYGNYRTVYRFANTIA